MIIFPPEVIIGKLTVGSCLSASLWTLAINCFEKEILLLLDRRHFATGVLNVILVLRVWRRQFDFASAVYPSVSIDAASPITRPIASIAITNNFPSILIIRWLTNKLQYKEWCDYQERTYTLTRLSTCSIVNFEFNGK